MSDKFYVDCVANMFSQYPVVRTTEKIVARKFKGGSMEKATLRAERLALILNSRHPTPAPKSKPTNYAAELPYNLPRDMQEGTANRIQGIINTLEDTDESTESRIREAVLRLVDFLDEIESGGIICKHGDYTRRNKTKGAK